MSSKIWSKLKAIAALLMVFFLVFATNQMDKNHFREIQESFSSVYEDRLVAKDYIYKISRLLDIKKNDLITGEVSSITYDINDSIQVLINKYSKTKLTYKEKKYIPILEKKLNELYKIEEKGTASEKAEQIAEVLSELDNLAEIQMLEAKRELNKSNRLVKSSDLISNLEIGVLILIGVIIQLLIFLKPMK